MVNPVQTQLPLGFSPDIFDAITKERAHQDTKWGGAEHDDHHTSNDWVAYIARYVGKSVIWPFDIPTFKRRMVQIAALAVAAIEWADRYEKVNNDRNNRLGSHT